jgi:predicted DNA-binding transcriptional regulator AlpA
LGAKISVWKASEVQAYIDDHCMASNDNEVRHG